MNSYRYIAMVIFIILLAPAVFWTHSAHAATMGDSIPFNVDRGYDVSGRTQIQATLIKTSTNLYFYVETTWWNVQLPAKRDAILANLNSFSTEFDNHIYPVLTSIYGFEWKAGVDGDSRITILFEPMKDGSAGYFRSTDEYLKLQLPESNEREMLYIAADHLDDSQLKVFVGHEFTHLITFNQKDRLQGIQEEVWLNEARADYSSTLLGYDDSYEGSNLQKRVKDFLSAPSDSLTEWQETKYDYSVANLFTHYLVDHYSISILADSMKSKLVGIASINEVLLRKGIKKNFSQIFTDWTVATLLNNCTQDINYCYLNQNLKTLRINPTLNFLPLAGNSSLSVTNVTKNWSGNWQKIIGGNGDLTLQFSSLAGLNFQVPYVTVDKDNVSTVNFLALDKDEKGQLTIKNFGDRYTALIIIPSLQTKNAAFGSLEFTYPYTFTVSIAGDSAAQDATGTLMKKLLAQIESLKQQIAKLQPTTTSGEPGALCGPILQNLYPGMSRNGDVSCLQSFLVSQGQDIYPEGFITGNFGTLTASAVRRFQQKYAGEILAPLRLSSPTGVVGESTRKKINQLLHR